MSAATARVSDKGAARWAQGHPWIYRSDVLAAPAEPGITAVQDRRGRFLGTALVSPRSEIRLRLLERSDRPVDGGWWRSNEMLEPWPASPPGCSAERRSSASTT